MHNNKKHQQPTTLLQHPDGHTFELILGEKYGSDTPPVLIVPAMGVPARKYLPLLQALNQNCLNVAIMEWRGIESSSQRASRSVDFGFKEMLEDMRLAVAHLCQRHGANHVYLLGHSLGGQLSYLFCARHPELVAGLIGVASGSPYYRNWRGLNRIGLYLFSAFMRLCALVLGYFPGRRLGFGGNEARGMLRDWHRAVRTGRYQPKGIDYDFEGSLGQVRTRALMMTIDDDWLAPPESSKDLASKLSAGDVTHRHLTADQLGSGLSGHFNWMKQPQAVVQAILVWLEN